MTWLIVAIYLKARHPNCRLVRVQVRKVVALREYLRHSSKSDKIDALTPAKRPFIDPKRLDEIYLPPAKIYAIQRLARQRKLRDELLNREVFYTLTEAKILIEQWRTEYNQVRPHSSLGYRPPAPDAIMPVTLT